MPPVGGRGTVVGIAGALAGAVVAALTITTLTVTGSASFTGDVTMTGGANALKVGTPTADTTDEVTIEATDAARTPLSLELATSQTANAFEVKSQGGTIVNWLSPDGYPIGTCAKFCYLADHFTTPSGFTTATGSLSVIRVVSGTGTNVVQVSTYAGALGAARAGTGTDTTGRAALGSNGTNQFEPAIGRLVYRTKCALPNLSDGTETYTSYIGFSDSYAGAATDGMYFRYTHGTNSGKWEAVCAGGSTETVVDTGIAAAAATWQTFEIDCNSGATSVVFKINGATVATIATANIPSAGEAFSYMNNIVKSAGTTERYLYCDYIELLVVPTSQ